MDKLGAETSSVTHVPQPVTIPIERSQQIRRTVECKPRINNFLTIKKKSSLGKYISTVSTSSHMTQDHRLLMSLLERLIEEKKFDLSLVQQPLIDRVFFLFNIFI